ncbi:MAG: hypothetical protein ACJ739_11775 [Acidimicrobiales bacterium]
MEGSRGLVVLGALAVAAIVVVYVVTRSDPPDTVVLVGDSIAEEAAPYLEDALDGPKLVPRVFGGTAPCDWTVEDVGAHKGDLVVLSFTGNSTTPCMAAPGGGYLQGQALVDKYAKDVAALVGGLRDLGADVLLVGQPERGPGATGAEDVHGINAAYEALADDDGVSFVDAGAAVENEDGTFAADLPCADGERECGKDGRNRVRNTDGVHLCPQRPGGRQCKVYSSGAFRFAGAIADEIKGR